VTYSILAIDPAAGQLGVATATHAFGAGPVADHVRPGVGVVATQAFVEISYGPLGLDLMQQGRAPVDALTELVEADPDRDIRQVAYLDAAGATAEYTGGRCVPSCGSVVGGNALAVGNMLDNDGVLPQMVEAAEHATGELADRLLAALEAGERAGGDVRGRMSAALRVVTIESPAQPWEGTVVDLRIDLADDPLARLAESLRMSRAYRVFFASVFAPGLVTNPEPVTGERLDTALAGLADTQDELGADPEPTVWRGVLLLRAGETGGGCAFLAEALRVRPGYARFLDGLARVRTIPLSAEQILATAHAGQAAR
jgi:uncharacterized Ntn-hydrolase superfamily protein